MFQFHSGSIKREMSVFYSAFLTPRFNSIVVRLNEKNDMAYELSAAVFQFHSGSIKRVPLEDAIEAMMQVSIP